MNPRALLLWTVAALAVPLASTAPAPRVVALAAGLDVTLATARPGTRLRPLLVGVAAGGAVAVLLEVLLSHHGAHVVATLPGWLPAFGGSLTGESALYGVVVALGLAACAAAVAPLSTALEPHGLVDALPAGLHRTATVAAAALNLLPGMVRSAVAVIEAQRLRGWRPAGPRSWAAVAVPVVVTAMEDSIGTAEAMEARAFGSGRRTRFSASGITTADAAVVAASILALVLVVAARAGGLDDDWTPFPSPVLPEVSALPLVAALLLALPAALWHRSS